jgi:hypothetical protein
MNLLLQAKYRFYQHFFNLITYININQCDSMLKRSLDVMSIFLIIEYVIIMFILLFFFSINYLTDIYSIKL